MEEATTKKLTKDKPLVSQHEDAALKVVMQFFAEELLPCLGIEGRVVSVAPTELVQLEIKKLYEDFNLVMEDGSWKHFEFQSRHEGEKGLKRFRSYEALASYMHGVSITTYVLFSGNIKNPVTEYTEGINTYRVVPVIMTDYDADRYIGELQGKQKRGEKITRSDLVWLTLCPLMKGRMSQKDRIIESYKITKEAEGVSKEDIRKIEAVIYAMADKFLESVDMEEIKEMMHMTRLGKMLVEEGIEQGIERAKLENARNLLEILDEKVIAEKIGLPLSTVQELKKEHKETE